MEVTIKLESMLFPYREAIVESASRVLPAGSTLSAEALDNDDMGAGQGVSIQVIEREDELDYSLREKLLGAIKERAELEVFREWYRSFPLRGSASPFSISSQ
jgi:hypothetical protein